MPQGQIQPRTWFVQFGPAVSAASAFAADSSELEHQTRSWYQVHSGYDYALVIEDPRVIDQQWTPVSILSHSDSMK